MSGATGYIYHPDYLLYQFGPEHPFQPGRAKWTLEMLTALGVMDGTRAKVVEPSPVEMEVLNTVHPPEFVSLVERLCKDSDLLDQGDTPGNPGLFKGALAVVGGSVRGAQGIMEGEFVHAFNPAGGLHHARPDRSSGFCVFNDIAVTIRVLQQRYGLDRVAVVDIDGHHGDGTQSIFYHEEVLTISFHRYGRGFFPGTGTIEERGEGQGKGFNINIPLPEGTDDVHYLEAYRSVVVPALRAYRPQFIIHQFGADAHRGDPLVGLGLSTHGYLAISEMTHSLAHELCDGRYLVTGGGGYDLDATCRTWSLMFAHLAHEDLDPTVLSQLHDKGTFKAQPDMEGTVEEVVRVQGTTAISLLERSLRDR